MRADIAITYISYRSASAVRAVSQKPYLAITRLWVRLTSDTGAQDIGACVLEISLLTMPVKIVSQMVIPASIVTRIGLLVIELATFPAYASSAGISFSFKQRLIRWKNIH